MAMPNRYKGQCLVCDVFVAPGDGSVSKVDGQWRTYCAAHTVGKVSVKTAEPTVEVTMEGDLVVFRPTGYLGNDLFNVYRDACNGAAYDRDAKVNRATVEVAAVILGRLRSSSFRLAADPAVVAAVQAWSSAHDAAAEAAEGRAAEVDERLQARGLALFPFQRTGVSWLAPRKGAVLGDDMGLGKTIQALTAAPDNAPVLVVCPAVAKGVWLRECSRWRPDLTPAVLKGRGSFRWPRPGEMVVTNYDILPPGPSTKEKPDEQVDEIAKKVRESAPEGCVVIGDEFHLVKSPKAARSRSWRNITKGARDKGGKTWGLTATPLLNKPPELWALLESVDCAKQAFGNWYNFTKLFGGRSNGWGTDWSGESIDSARVAPRLREVMLRRLKVDVLSQLPAKRVEVLDVDLSEADIKRLDAIKAELDEHGIDIADAFKQAGENREIAFELISKARAILARAKVPHAFELVSELEESGEACVVFSAHRDPISFFASRSGWSSITGDTPNEERTKIEDAFQAGHLKGVAGTIKAAGVAITLTRAANAVFVDAEWTPALNSQAEDRIYRIGQARAVVITYLRANHPIDERLFELLSIKRGIIAASVDAAKGDADQVERLGISAADLAAEAEAARASVNDARSGASQAEQKARAAIREQAAGQQRRETTRKAVDGNRNRGWNIPDELFYTPHREARTEDEKWAALSLARLARVDGDHARDKNDVGFSSADTHLGHGLALAAGSGMLNDGEWRVAIEVASRYPRQVGKRPNHERESKCPSCGSPSEGGFYCNGCNAFERESDRRMYRDD